MSLVSLDVRSTDVVQSGCTLFRCSFLRTSADKVSVSDSETMAAAVSFSSVEALDGRRADSRCSAHSPSFPLNDSKASQTCIPSHGSRRMQWLSEASKQEPSSIHVGFRGSIAKKTQARMALMCELLLQGSSVSVQGMWNIARVSCVTERFSLHM